MFEQASFHLNMNSLRDVKMQIMIEQGWGEMQNDQILHHTLRSQVLLSDYLRRQQALPGAERKETRERSAELTSGYGSHSTFQWWHNYLECLDGTILDIVPVPQSRMFWHTWPLGTICQVRTQLLWQLMKESSLNNKQKFKSRTLEVK